jgi:NADH dehydrogenase
MAAIGKHFAIMESGRFKLAGIITWFIWAFVHIMFLPQLQNRRRMQNQWFWSYFTGQRSSRLVDEAPRI